MSVFCYSVNHFATMAEGKQFTIMAGYPSHTFLFYAWLIDWKTGHAVALQTLRSLMMSESQHAHSVLAHNMGCIHSLDWTTGLVYFWFLHIPRSYFWLYTFQIFIESWSEWSVQNFQPATRVIKLYGHILKR